MTTITATLTSKLVRLDSYKPVPFHGIGSLTGSSFGLSSSLSTNTSRNSRYFIGATATGFYINPGLS